MWLLHGHPRWDLDNLGLLLLARVLRLRASVKKERIKTPKGHCPDPVPGQDGWGRGKKKKQVFGLNLQILRPMPMGFPPWRRTKVCACVLPLGMRDRAQDGVRSYIPQVLATYSAAHPAPGTRDDLRLLLPDRVLRLRCAIEGRI